MSISEQTRKDFLAAWELVRNPETFLTQIPACDVRGRSVPSGDKAAVRWCSFGAMWRVVGYGDPRSALLESMFDMADAIERNDAGHESACAMWREVAAKHGIELPGDATEVVS
jgi:hypothetical protein